MKITKTLLRLLLTFVICGILLGVIPKLIPDLPELTQAGITALGIIIAGYLMLRKNFNGTR